MTTTYDKPLSDEEVSRGPCEKCGSSDANVLYTDHHTKCYSCEYFVPPPRDKTERRKIVSTPAPTKKSKRFPLQPLAESFEAIADRGISAEAAARYQVEFIDDPSNPMLHRYPYFKNGKHYLNKVRARKEKRFGWEGEGEVADADLFGMQAFPAGCARAVTIVEGECDAMATFMMTGSRYPVVSVKNATSAVKDIQNNFAYLDSFEEIVICFDKDEAKVNKKTGEVRYPGQEAAAAAAELLPIGKVRIMTLREYKDPNDYLRSGKGKAFIKEWYDAPKFTPAALRSGKELWDEIIEVPEYETVSYPFEGLNQKTYGMRLSELVIVNAQQKIGKSTLLGEITYHLLQETEAGIGIMRLEETNRDTALNLMSLHSGKRLHLPDVWEDLPQEEIKKYYDETVNTDRLVIWDHFGSNSIDAVLSQIRNMHALGCKYVILDHLSIIVSDQSGDERKQLDELATRLKTLCMELNICVLAVVHQNRQGEIRGTAGIGQLANIVIRLDRDKESRDEFTRNCTEVTVSDNRFCGDTGLACYLYYDSDTGRMANLSEEEFVSRSKGGGKPVDYENDSDWEDVTQEIYDESN